jgi:hypothetical protein
LQPHAFWPDILKIYPGAQNGGSAQKQKDEDDEELLDLKKEELELEKYIVGEDEDEFKFGNSPLIYKISSILNAWNGI